MKTRFSRAVKFTARLLCLSLILRSPAVAQPAPPVAPNRQPIAPRVREYLEKALNIMQKNSLRKKEVDWVKLRRETFEKAQGAQQTIDSWDALRFALTTLGDGHSFLQLTDELRKREEEHRVTPLYTSASVKAVVDSPYSSRRKPELFFHKIGDRVVARVVVPLFLSQQGDSFATTLHRFIAEADGKNPLGWIIDLRGNGGGNIFPMLAGIGALLGEGNAYYSLDAEGRKTQYFYKNGRAGLIEPGGKQTFVTQIVGPVYQLRKQTPVAVLIDGGTASSGEGIAVAFRGRAKTRFFGNHTYGISSSTEGFRLSDGANLVLATDVAADKRGKIYPSGLAPDEVVASHDKILPPAEDPTIHAALGWLGEQVRE